MAHVAQSSLGGLESDAAEWLPPVEKLKDGPEDKLRKVSWLS